MKLLPPILLASSSPRRISLLNQLGLSVKVHPPNIKEIRKPGETAEQIVLRLSEEKAKHITMSDRLRSGSRLIIAADTLVVSPNGKTILGKPTSTQVAVKTLKILTGKTHQVLTGYCLILETKKTKAPKTQIKMIVRVVRSKVTMRDLSEQSIRNYVRTGEPMDKSGAYAAQGIGMALIEKISGSYSNVVGLPIAQVIADIETLCGIDPLEWAQKKK